MACRLPGLRPVTQLRMQMPDNGSEPATQTPRGSLACRLLRVNLTAGGVTRVVTITMATTAE
jgi:hypothetical protein